MNILISNSKGTPIYEQISEQIKEQIINDSLKADEMLPSIRNLAKDLKISVITTKRAYTELENSGYIYTLPGKGSFVAEKDKELIRENYLKEIDEHIEKIVKLASSCKLSKNDLIKRIYKEGINERD